MREGLAAWLNALAARIRPVRAPAPLPRGIYQVSWAGRGLADGSLRTLALSKNGKVVHATVIDRATDDGRELWGSALVEFDPAHDTLEVVGIGRGVAQQVDVPQVAVVGTVPTPGGK
jgi:hypothetical protein